MSNDKIYPVFFNLPRFVNAKRDKIMREKFMDNWAGTPNVLSASLTMILLFINKVTLSDGAAIAAIVAGLTTGGLNVVKYFQMKKREKKENSNL